MTMKRLMEIFNHASHDLIAFEKAYFDKVIKLFIQNQGRHADHKAEEDELIQKFESIFTNTGKIDEINKKNTDFLNAAKNGDLEMLKQIITDEKMTEVNQKFYPHEHGHHHHNIGGIVIDQDQVKP